MLNKQQLEDLTDISIADEALCCNNCAFDIKECGLGAYPEECFIGQLKGVKK